MQSEMVDRLGCVPTSASSDMRERTLRAIREAGAGWEFRVWVFDNWAIWAEFCKLADLMRTKGRAYYSARAVLHVLRWHKHLEDVNCTFKINNRWSAPMARTYNAMHGVEFFRTREAE